MYIQPRNFRLQPQNKARQLWKQYMPAYPFDYAFLDTDYNPLYRSEERTGKLFKFFTGIAIIISGLGLFGLTSFITEQRTKEIEIREVLSATVLNITSLLSMDFLKLVAIAIAIALPVAWLRMDQWLKDFAYKVDNHWWTFPLAGLVLMVIALISICIQSIKSPCSTGCDRLKRCRIT